MPSVAITTGVEPAALTAPGGHAPLKPPEADTPARHAPWHGVLLAGVPGTNAYSALQSQVDEIADPAASGRLRWRAVIEPIATVGQVNAALTAAGARIVSMQPGHTEVILEMAAQDNSAAARFAEAHLIASRAFTSIHTAGSLRAHVPTPPAQVQMQMQDVDPSLPGLVEDTASPP